MTMDNDVIASNIAIAFFDGYKFYPEDSMNGSIGVYRKKNKIGMLATDFKYNTSWAWFMPVFFKFRDLQNITMDIYETHHDWCGNIAQAISLSGTGTPKEAHSSLVEAITWHTQLIEKIKQL